MKISDASRNLPSTNWAPRAQELAGDGVFPRGDDALALSDAEIALDHGGPGLEVDRHGHDRRDESGNPGDPETERFFFERPRPPDSIPNCLSGLPRPAR